MGSFGQCRGPLWDRDDFSRCFLLDYLQTLLPLITCALSLLYLFAQIINTFRIGSKSASTKPVYTAVTTNGDFPRYRDDASDTDTEEEFEEDHLALRVAITHDVVVEVKKPRAELTLVIIEELAVIAQVGIHLTLLIGNLSVLGSDAITAAAAETATWTYVAILVSIRLSGSATSRFSFPALWHHTAFLYCTLWFFSLLVFRSALIRKTSTFMLGLVSADFALTSTLALIALCSREGNKAVELEYEGGLEPSKEQTASLMSQATFAWADSIIYKGYKRTLEISDVWNLAAKDKAARVLEDYRLIKKTTKLSWHLLRYFRTELLIQASWAGLEGVLTFAPTLLLKAILEYVESPSLVPQQAAWFYVALLFASAISSSLAANAALWIGRKVCIRLRAIIIGEIYAKALKRKASASTDKILGQDEDKDEKKQTLVQKIKSFGRKKKSKKNTDDKSEDKEAKDAQVSSGTIINLMAVDSFKIAEVGAYLHFLWASTPVMFILAIGLLYKILGYSSIVGIGMMVLLLPVNMYIAQQFSAVQKKILASTDARIHTTNEVLSNIRIIKFFAWEQRFMALVNEKRAAELKSIRRRYIVWAFAATVWSGAPILITFLSFLVYTKIEHKDLIPSIAFTALSLFQILRIPLDQLADMLAHVQESKVSVDRVEEFLNEPETDKYNQLKHAEYDETGNPVIGFKNSTFSWATAEQEDDETFRLIDLNVMFKPDQLNVIVGPTGSGKSSLLMALLGEMNVVRGKVYLPGGRPREELKPHHETGVTESVAYCAQQPWLVNANIRENIVFASPWDAKRYQQVLIACSLQRDLDILDHGDETLVGEKGVTLSGGQKQRISLARALYSRARYILLDDVLSAVDSHTAKWIFDQALLGPLMYHRTCILVTHNVSLCVPHAEHTVVMENGRIVTQGSLSEVVDSGKLGEDLSKSRPPSRGPSRVASKVPSEVGGDECLGETYHIKTGNGHINGDAHAANGTIKDKKSPPADDQLESKAEGGVNFAIILMYLKSMGSWWYWSIVAFGFIAQQISSVATNVWIRQWANAYASESVNVMGQWSQSASTGFNSISGHGFCAASGTCDLSTLFSSSPVMPNSSAVHDFRSQTIFKGHNEVDADYYLSVYALLGIAFAVITLVREGILFAGSLTASRRIHQRLMESVTHAKFRFFDSTPLGQIMNRFSKDIEAVDQEVAPVAVGVIHCLASIVTIVVLISVITPAFLIAGVFITILYFLIGRLYISSSRDLKRMESVQRSPIYQQFGETLNGMTTIRAYGDERRFIRENLKKINTHSRPFIYLWAANRWLAFRVDVVGALVSFFTGVFVVLSVGRIDAGAAGLAMSYAVTFTENVLWFVRLYASNEQNMNSVERIKEYLDVEQEAKPIVPDNRPPGNWPAHGAVEFISYSTRYRPDFDQVLRDVTFKVAPGEKVGVVGRTGAGKSSLALALFRALEAEQGKILVDDVDIGLIGLQDLRENIVMVPQDPTLFTGTIRSNLDPFNLFTDEEIFIALRRVQLVGSPGSGITTANNSRPATPAKQILDAAGESPAAAHSTATTAVESVNSTDIEDPIAGTTPHDTPENKNIFTNLSHPIAESGSNLSQGQRQLLCLARALLKQPRVLLMDEATASIDYATDAKIQATIREEAFSSTTTITIAHRLNTIADYDQVLVLDKGTVVEFGSPWTLLQDKDGIFRGMCELSGEWDVLKQIAKKAAVTKGVIEEEGEGEGKDKESKSAGKSPSSSADNVASN